MADEKRQQLEEIFNLFDKDKSSKIDAKELNSAIKEYYKSQGQEVDQGQIDADVAGILKACDTTHDGQIDKAEWFKFFEC